VTLTPSQTPANVGRKLVYTATVGNDGPGTAVGVSLTLVAPAATFDSVEASQGSCSNLVCTIGSLAPHASATVTMIVEPTATGPLSASAAAYAENPDPNPTNNTAGSSLDAVVGPTLTSLTPTLGSVEGGTKVTIKGTGFTGATNVLFEDTPATSFTVDSDTQITAVAPANAEGAAYVQVLTPNGQNVYDSDALFTYSSGPDAEGVYPMTVPADGGTTAYVEGLAFEHVTKLLLDGTPIKFSQAGTQADGYELLQFAVPPGHGTHTITVVDPDGSSSTTFAYYEHPDVADLTPTSGRSEGGYPVTIEGDNFQSGAVAHFGSTPATTVSVAPDKLTVVAPPGTGSVKVTATNPAGGASPSSVTFTYEPTPCADTSDCAFQAWAEVDGTGSFSTGKKEPPVTGSGRDLEPDNRSMCFTSMLNYTCIPAKGPVEAKLTLPIFGGAATVAGDASADPYTAKVDLDSSALGAGKGVSGTATGNAEVNASNSWVITPEPTKPIKVALVVHISIDTALSPLSDDGTGDSLSVNWFAAILAQGATGGKAAEGTYSAKIEDDGHDDDGVYLLDVSNTETVNGQKTTPNGTLVIPFTASPSDWNHLASDFRVLVQTQTKKCETRCETSAHVVIDPVVVPLTPGYRVAAKAPATLSPLPLLRSVPANAARGATVTVSGARFGAARGRVLLQAAGSRTARALLPIAWDGTRVVFRVPAGVRTGRAWLSVRTKGGTATNRLPLAIVRRADRKTTSR